MTSSSVSADPFVLAFGDSLTAGYGLRSHESFPSRLQALLRERRPQAVVDNQGVSGETTAGGLARLPRILTRLTRTPDLAIVELGANDLLRGIDPGRTRDNLSGIVEELIRCRIPVLVAGMLAPPLLGAFATRFNAVFPEVAAKHGASLYPFFLDGVVGDPTLVLADRIHPNARAIDVVARRILPHVERALDASARRRAA